VCFWRAGCFLGVLAGFCGSFFCKKVFFCALDVWDVLEGMLNCVFEICFSHDNKLRNEQVILFSI